MTAPYRAAVIAAAERLLDAARRLPAEGSSRTIMLAALERYDEAEELLDARVREYVGQRPGGER